MRVMKAFGMALVLGVCVAGCSSLMRGGEAGFSAGISGGPAPSPSPVGRSPLDYYGEFIAGLLAYAVGSAGKGFVRSKLGLSVSKAEEEA